MTIKTTRPYFTLSNDRRDDGGAQSFLLRASKREAGRLLQRRRRYRHGGPTFTRMAPELETELLERGLIQPYGCDCAHCRNDWDCCGRLFPAHVTAKRVRGGIRITQSYYRNI